jgi:putative transposase
MLRDFCGLYNAGLQQRIEAYRRRGISVTYNMQADELKAVRCAALGIYNRATHLAWARLLRGVAKLNHIGEVPHDGCS